MAIEPLRIADAIRDRYRRYLKTALHIAPRYADLREQFHAALEQPGALFAGPYLHGLPPYEQAESLGDLVKDGILPSAVGGIPFLGDVHRPLYWHQAETIRRVRAGHNVVLSTGTGSGKTLAFLVPVLSAILERPASGVHAVLLYPMNALVNDQLKYLRRVLGGRSDVRFGRYVNIQMTPQRETDGRRLYPQAPSNEVVSREAFRANPPHILITNYAMLEYLLLRPDDSPLFEGPWRFVVVDEVHTYRGAKGCEIAFLMRRLKHRVRPGAGAPIQFVATSATVASSSPASRRQVADFAATLCDASFNEADVIEARTRHVPAAGPSFGAPDERLYREPALLEACDTRAWSDETEAAMVRGGIPRPLVSEARRTYPSDFEAALFHIFSRDTHVASLRGAAQRPARLEAAAQAVFGRSDQQAEESLVGLVRISSLARVPGDIIRLAPCRYHMFCRGLAGAYVALHKEQGRNEPKPELLLTPSLTGGDGTTRTLELRTCRKCGQPYLLGYEFQDQGGSILKAFGSPQEERGTPVWLLWQPPPADFRGRER
jgi:antitoxin (DNA-binding transcriptional repressor) of toxin-antitoxin stability system